MIKNCLGLIVVLVAGLFAPLVQAHTVGLSFGTGGAAKPGAFSLRYEYDFLDFSDESLVFSVGGRYSSSWKNSAFELGDSKQSVSALAVQTINVLLAADYKFWGDLGIGLNIDLMGLSFGPGQNLALANGGSTRAKPHSTNILLGGRNDRGSLNSEFYLSYQIAELTIRSGLSHRVVEYEAQVATEKLQRFYDLFFVSADIKF